MSVGRYIYALEIVKVFDLDRAVDKQYGTE